MDVARERALRRSMTDAERKVWQILRSRQLLGYKFRRQQPIGNYIVDFVCFENRLVVEIDGSQHVEQKAYDEKRSKWLESQGFQILRFWDNEVLTNPEGLVDAVWEAGVHSRWSTQRTTPHLNPLPQGERRFAKASRYQRLSQGEGESAEPLSSKEPGSEEA